MADIPRKRLMPRYANVRAREHCSRLLLRMGFVETAHNGHWRYRRLSGLGSVYEEFLSATMKSDARFMGEIITQQLRMTVDEFREAKNGNIPERFTNPEFWSN